MCTRHHQERNLSLHDAPADVTHHIHGVCLGRNIRLKSSAAYDPDCAADLMAEYTRNSMHLRYYADDTLTL